jgi:hypothetical protein
LGHFFILKVHISVNLNLLSPAKNERKLDVNFVQRICGSPIVDTEPLIGDLLRGPGIDSRHSGIDSSKSISGLYRCYKYGLRAEPVQLFDVDIYFTSPFFCYVLDTLLTYVW